MFAATCVITTLLAVANWWSRAVNHRGAEQITKPATTIGAIAIAVTAGAPAGPTTAGVVALVLCLVGDVALLPAVDRFITGLAAFLAGHIAFGVMFATVGLTSVRLGGLGLLVCALVGAVTAVPILRGAERHGLRRPVTTYLMVISAMVVLGWSTGNWLFVAGSTAFIVSDAILGWGRFVRDHRWTSVAVMVTYHLAIVALAAGLRLV